MESIYWQHQLYHFLHYCQKQSEDKKLPKNILDCGAGGTMPPLGLFNSFGYTTTGIEFSDSQIVKANEFEKKQSKNYNILKGDMRNLPFGENSFSYVYSYNSVFHMKKTDIIKSIEEMKRVTKPGGLLYLNLLTENDTGFGSGEKVGNGEYQQEEHGEQVIHSYFSNKEHTELFSEDNVILREDRILERKFEAGDNLYKQGYVDYIIEI